MASKMLSKRKADELAEAPVAKKAREDSVEDDNDSNFSDASSEEDEEPSQSTNTPGTPLTTYSTPRTPREKNWHCLWPGCGKAFVRPSRLEEHIRSHTNDRPFVCTQCSKTFLRDNHLKRHIKTAHTSEREHVCDWPGCDKAFATATRLRRHVAAHQDKEQYRCTAFPPCNEIFRKHATLQKHIASVHLNQKPFPCDIIDVATGEPCTHGYETQSALLAHQGRVHGGNRYICTMCSPSAGETANSTSNLFDDGPSTNADTSTLADDQAISFPTYAALQSHIRTAHPPTCPHCARPFTTPRELRQHIEIAHGAVPLAARQTFMCDVPGCGRGFTKRGNLNVHKRNVHAKLKTFICGETELSSSRQDAVAAWHAEGSIGACGFAFGTKANLEEHVRTQHLRLEGTRAAKQRKAVEEAGGNVEALKREKRSRKKGTGKQRVLAELTGGGFDKLGRTIECLVPGCANRFVRVYDRDVHCRAAHNMTDTEIEEAEAERDALAGGPFWIGGGGGGGGEEDGFFDEEDEEANEALDAEAGITAGMQSIEVSGCGGFAPEWADGGVLVDPALLAHQGACGLEAVEAYVKSGG